MFDKYKDTDRNTTDYQPYFTVDEPIAESGESGSWTNYEPQKPK